MRIFSSSFENNGMIPSMYTCQGNNVNPPLEIADVPKEAKSLVLIMDDPDVPAYIRSDRMYDHWILFNLLPTICKIEENSSPQGTYGKNSSGKNSYIGPCPPDREHRYFFKLYALDAPLKLPSGSAKKEIEQAMQGHILAQCQLIGRYQKS